jgi:hypothetical protein
MRTVGRVIDDGNGTITQVGLPPHENNISIEPAHLRQGTTIDYWHLQYTGVARSGVMVRGVEMRADKEAGMRII